MGNYTRGHQYWSTKQENLCLQWLSATTEIEYTRIHNALLPALNYMVELITNRYFSVPSSKQTQLKKDCAQEVFLKLKQYVPNKGDSGSYAFCSLIIKHYLLEQVVLNRDKIRHTENLFEYHDELPESAEPISYGENRQFPTEAVLKRFEAIKRKFEGKPKTTKNRHGNPTQGKRYKNQIHILNLCIEYIRKYENLNPSAMTDYVFLNQNGKLKKATIVFYFKRMFNIGTSLVVEVKEESLSSNKYSSMLEDDLPPSVGKGGKTYKRTKQKKLNKQYPDMDKYRFM